MTKRPSYGIIEAIGGIHYVKEVHKEHKYSIIVMCEFFGVSRSGYYCFGKRMNKPEKHRQAVEIIAECQKKTNKTYGYRRVHMFLTNTIA